MTAVVGVLNKRAVAIAADSAVTVGDTHKVMNTGNKIFSLSKYAPVGVAIYGAESLMSTPWEVIIKCYRRELGQKKFSYLREYVEDFLRFLKKHEFFSSLEIQRQFLALQIKSFLHICETEAKNRKVFSTNPPQAVLEELNECMKLNQASPIVFPDFQGYSYSDFLKYASAEIRLVVNQSTILDVAKHFDAFAESYYHYMRIANIKRGNDTGLVFVGYGEEEIYPCLYNIVTTIGFEHKLQYCYGEKTEITNDGTGAAIVPFAQVEATQTVIRGINPTFYDIISSNFTAILEHFKRQIGDLARNAQATTLATQIDSIDVNPFSTAFTQATKSEFFNNYTVPLVTTVGHLAISDMANVAESLVALTSLVNRMSPKEESVGGPVDVAVISKGDGLIWIKRKHYFNPELNAHFFSNYNNEG